MVSGKEESLWLVVLKVAACESSGRGSSVESIGVGKSMVWTIVCSCGQWYGVDGVGSITAMDEGGGGPARAWESHSSTCSRDP